MDERISIPLSLSIPFVVCPHLLNLVNLYSGVADRIILCNGMLMCRQDRWVWVPSGAGDLESWPVEDINIVNVSKSINHLSPILICSYSLHCTPLLTAPLRRFRYYPLLLKRERERLGGCVNYWFGWLAFGSVAICVCVTCIICIYICIYEQTKTLLLLLYCWW